MAKVTRRRTRPRIPTLPELLADKIYKTGMTRGAVNQEIYQNRVLRNNTVLVHYAFWTTASLPPPGETAFENGFIALVSPEEFFNTPTIVQDMATKGLTLGTNALVFYETRDQWNTYSPNLQGWTPATQRISPLGGQYASRVPANTSKAGDGITHGFHTTRPKGAGIRVFEYAPQSAIAACRLQLEYLFWHCYDASTIALMQGMTTPDISIRRDDNSVKCQRAALDDFSRLIAQRLLNNSGRTICPLCLEEVSAQGFFSKVEQAEGRIVPDSTITQLNLFHIEELRVGVFGHRPYNLGWGHHHCNVVVKDSGIAQTVTWMAEVVDRNIAAGYLELSSLPVASAP